MAPVSLDTMVDEYLNCGNKNGFAVAETILAAFAEVPGGECCTVKHENRQKCIDALKAGVDFLATLKKLENAIAQG
jgi:hypothetical protein